MQEQMLIVGSFEQVADELPFAMLGVDSDNDSAFMSEACSTIAKATASCKPAREPTRRMTRPG